MTCWCSRGTRRLWWGQAGWGFGVTPGFSLVPSPAPILPCWGQGSAAFGGDAQPLCLPGVSWPGTHGDMKSSSPTSELSLCKLRTNIDRGWANAARISPARACFAAPPPTITHATLTKALVCGYSCVYTTSACVALPKGGRRKGGVIFFFF